MVTLRELAAESIGRITRKTLEPQLAQLETALGANERPVAVAPGQDQAAGVAIMITDHRVLISRGAPFARPELSKHDLGDIASASATAEDGESTWALAIAWSGGSTILTGMFDRDAQRIEGLLA